ncbi:MAG: hypothetical protein GEU81_12020 [Nitriliruptorales bacterium]|nr:hypothetical protein [Nitriliruptorales bacterium]
MPNAFQRTAVAPRSRAMACCWALGGDRALARVEVGDAFGPLTLDGEPVAVVPGRLAGGLSGGGQGCHEHH